MIIAKLHSVTLILSSCFEWNHGYRIFANVNKVCCPCAQGLTHQLAGLESALDELRRNGNHLKTACSSDDHALVDEQVECVLIVLVQCIDHGLLVCAELR